MNGHDAAGLANPGRRGRTLVMFLSTMCESCQTLVEPLNGLAQEPSRGVAPVVIMQASEDGCKAFLNMFPLQMPVVCDSDRKITSQFNVHRSPFGLLYDSKGLLVRKGAIGSKDHLLALLGELEHSDGIGDGVYPRAVTT